jgi:hypothetical protein
MITNSPCTGPSEEIPDTRQMLPLKVLVQDCSARKIQSVASREGVGAGAFRGVQVSRVSFLWFDRVQSE